MEPAVDLRDVAFAYPRAPQVLQGVRLEVPRGAAVAVLGPSGSGKTTLLKLAAGLLRPTHGEAVLRLPQAMPAHAHLAAGRVGYIPQHLGLVRSRRVLDNVLAGALHRAPWLPSLVGDFPRAEVEAAEQALASVGLAHKARARAHALSGGERQRVAIARALVQRPPLLVADEFVSNLDRANADTVLRLAQGLRAEGSTLLMALHDLALARAHADILVVARGGRVRVVPIAELEQEAAAWATA